MQVHRAGGGNQPPAQRATQRAADPAAQPPHPAERFGKNHEAAAGEAEGGRAKCGGIAAKRADLQTNVSGMKESAVWQTSHGRGRA